MLPRFRTACLIVATLYVLIGTGMLLRGAAVAMAEYGVPEATLSSPHYVDAINWVYIHALVLGVLVGVVGWFAREPALKLWFARCAAVANGVFAALDFGHSSLGSGLYQGDASIIPGVMALTFMLLFVGPSLRRE